SFLLCLDLTSVCVNKPASSDALTDTSLDAGVLIGAERIVTQPSVPDVCLIRARLDVENANFADGSPAAGSAPGVLVAVAPTSGAVACVGLPQDSSAGGRAEAPRAPGVPAGRHTDLGWKLRAGLCRTRFRSFSMGSSLVWR